LILFTFERFFDDFLTIIKKIYNNPFLCNFKAECKVIITANQALRGGKIIDLKKNVDEALKNSPTIDHVFVYNRTENPYKRQAKDVPMDAKKLSQYSSECKPEQMDSEDPLFMLYTSGSTGKPKGLIHSTAGYLLQSAVTHQVIFFQKFNFNP
jgi:acetyl-CoA synthetase